MRCIFQEAAAVVDHVGEGDYDDSVKFPNAEDLLSVDDKDAMDLADESLRTEEMSGDNVLDEKYNLDLLNDKMEISEEVRTKDVLLFHLSADICFF